MSWVAEFTIPPEALPFGETLTQNPAMRLEVDRIVPTNQSALPFFWVWGSDPEQFMSAAEGESEIVDTRLLETVEDGALFRAEWSPNVAVIDELKELDAVIIESEGTAEQWRFEVRAQDRDQFLRFQNVFQEEGIPISLVRLYDLAEVVEGDRRTLTAQQREALIRAYREGYFDTPRQVTQEELGDDFDISHRAVSDRLRRGTRNLIAAALLPSSDE